MRVAHSLQSWEPDQKQPPGRAGLAASAQGLVLCEYFPGASAAGSILLSLLRTHLVCIRPASPLLRAMSLWPTSCSPFCSNEDRLIAPEGAVCTFLPPNYKWPQHELPEGGDRGTQHLTHSPDHGGHECMGTTKEGKVCSTEVYSSTSLRNIWWFVLETASKCHS